MPSRAKSSRTLNPGSETDGEVLDEAILLTSEHDRRTWAGWAAVESEPVHISNFAIITI